MSECKHDKRFGLFGLPKEARGCLACAYEQAVPDAERYRWLRGDTAGDHSQRWARWDVRCWLGQHWSDDLRREQLDAAIDAARGDHRTGAGHADTTG